MFLQVVDKVVDQYQWLLCQVQKFLAFKALFPSCTPPVGISRLSKWIPVVFSLSMQQWKTSEKPISADTSAIKTQICDSCRSKSKFSMHIYCPLLLLHWSNWQNKFSPWWKWDFTWLENLFLMTKFILQSYCRNCFRILLNVIKSQWHDSAKGFILTRQRSTATREKKLNFSYAYRLSARTWRLARFLIIC